MNEQNEISESEELKKLAPALSSLKKENCFSVPQNYFDEFPIKVKNRIDELGEASTKFSFNWLFNYKILAPVGTCIVLVLAGVFLYNPIQSIELEELTASEIEQSLEYYGYPAIDDELLAELYGSEEEAIEEGLTVEELTEDEIIDYLLNVNVDASQIYYEL
ncbi:MAG: hypothetical protein JKY42_10915 [Flavobacteriales bacterium]|nr:hypothetical protein [Flavobacteriales bacterium]